MDIKMDYHYCTTNTTSNICTINTSTMEPLLSDSSTQITHYVVKNTSTNALLFAQTFRVWGQNSHAEPAKTVHTQVTAKSSRMNQNCTFHNQCGLHNHRECFALPVILCLCFICVYLMYYDYLNNL